MDDDARAIDPVDDARAIDPFDDGLHVLEDRLQGKALHTVSTRLVRPAAATSPEQEWLRLSHLDYIWMQFYTPLICTFTGEQVRRDGGSLVVERLREALAEALVLFYPLAGRLLMKEGPPRVHCNDAGAVFTEASVDVDMEELRMEDFVPVPLLAGLAAAGFDRYPALPDLPDGLPTLIVQVTHFNCGGIALAANWSHGVADGQSGMHFMKSWSEIARGADVSLLPVHNRTLLKPRDPPVPGEIVKAVGVSPGAQAAAADRESKASGEGEAKKPQIATLTTEFTGVEIAAIRNAVEESGLTKADCLSTHIWRTTARARERSLDARVRLWILIEGRKKLGFPAGYFGNVVAMTPILTTVRELLHEPLGATAALIHTGIASITGEWFQGFVDLAHVSAGNDMFKPEPLGPDSESGVSYLVRFPYYELDFGFGAPEFAMRNTMGAWDGLVFVLPSARGKDHMVVMPNLQPAALSSFITMAHDLPEPKAE